MANLFEIELEGTTKCLEAPEEPPTVSIEKTLRLACNIDNESNPISMMQDGIQVTLAGQIEKFSQSLGRNAIY